VLSVLNPPHAGHASHATHDDAVTAADDSASIALHAQPKASRSNAAPAGKGVLNPPHAGHTSHAAHACALSRSLEQTCKAAALLRSLFSSSPFVISSLLQQSDHATHAGHTSHACHATFACVLSRSSEWTCEAAHCCSLFSQLTLCAQLATSTEL
jgi:hypothetical protein